MKYLKFLLIIGFINVSSSVFGQNVFPANGNVGIGTLTPRGNLDIVGNGTSRLKIGISSDNDHCHHIISYRDMVFNSTSGFIFRNNLIPGECTGSENLQELMWIKSNGKVGIGTTSPYFNLQVAGDIGAAGNRFNAQQGMINQTSTVNNWGSASNQGGIAINYDGRQSPIGAQKEFYRDFSIYNGKGSLMAFFDGSSGRVSIGNITSPAYKLTVDGTISASEVKVSTTPNSDYVFGPEYKLKSIEEVETFIKDNKHLPDVPSAQEFKENGVGLGEMDDMLLRKIEELTLYIIELKKENKELKELILNK